MSGEPGSRDPKKTSDADSKAAPTPDAADLLRSATAASSRDWEVPLESGEGVDADEEEADTPPGTTPPVPISTSTDVSKTATGYAIYNLLDTHKDAINRELKRSVTGFELKKEGDAYIFKGTIKVPDPKTFFGRDEDYKVKVNANGSEESELIHPNTPKIGAYLAANLKAGLTKYAVLYKFGGGLAALPEGNITLKLKFQALDPSHEAKRDELDALVEKEVLAFVKRQKFPPEFLNKFVYKKANGTPVPLNQAGKPLPKVKSIVDVDPKKSAAKPSPTADADSEHLKVDTGLRSLPSSPRSGSGTG